MLLLLRYSIYTQGPELQMDVSAVQSPVCTVQSLPPGAVESTVWTKGNTVLTKDDTVLMKVNTVLTKVKQY
jgi:hypothetical protein